MTIKLQVGDCNIINEKNDNKPNYGAFLKDNNIISTSPALNKSDVYKYLFTTSPVNVNLPTVNINLKNITDETLRNYIIDEIKDNYYTPIYDKIVVKFDNKINGEKVSIESFRTKYFITHIDIDGLIEIYDTWNTSIKGHKVNKSDEEKFWEDYFNKWKDVDMKGSVDEKVKMKEIMTNLSRKSDGSGSIPPNYPDPNDEPWPYKPNCYDIDDIDYFIYQSNKISNTFKNRENIDVTYPAYNAESLWYTDGTKNRDKFGGNYDNSNSNITTINYIEIKKELLKPIPVNNKLISIKLNYKMFNNQFRFYKSKLTFDHTKTYEYNEGINSSDYEDITQPITTQYKYNVNDTTISAFADIQFLDCNGYIYIYRCPVIENDRSNGFNCEIIITEGWKIKEKWSEDVDLTNLWGLNPDSSTIINTPPETIESISEILNIRLFLTDGEINKTRRLNEDNDKYIAVDPINPIYANTPPGGGGPIGSAIKLWKQTITYQNNGSYGKQFTYGEYTSFEISNLRVKYEPCCDSCSDGEDGEDGDIGECHCQSGYEGEAGETGNTGPEGDIGETGKTGDTGQPGQDGMNGISDKGDGGEMGEKGEKGIKGEKGHIGETGKTGDTGYSGEQGQKGDKGEKGDGGKMGEKGHIGETGITGEIGHSGHQGECGEKGVSYAKGFKGEPGHPGKKGETGDRGPPGRPATCEDINRFLRCYNC